MTRASQPSQLQKSWLWMVVSFQAHFLWRKDGWKIWTVTIHCGRQCLSRTYPTICAYTVLPISSVGSWTSTNKGRHTGTYYYLTSPHSCYMIEYITHIWTMQSWQWYHKWGSVPCGQVLLLESITLLVWVCTIKSEMYHNPHGSSRIIMVVDGCVIPGPFSVKEERLEDSDRIRTSLLVTQFIISLSNFSYFKSNFKHTAKYHWW